MKKERKKRTSLPAVKRRTETINKHLLAFRDNRTQAAMGTLYGVKQQTWAAWENGYRTPKKKIMKRIADDMGMTMEELFPSAFC